jgi:uncharacterized protein (DUF1697 family)
VAPSAKEAGRPAAGAFVCLLRGVNIGGVRIAMADLRGLLEQLGFTDVRTYVQSGNAVFRADGGDAAAIAAAIATGIAERFGHDVGVLVLPCAAFCEIARDNPLLQDGDQLKTLHATFLLDPVDDQAFAALDLPAAEGESARRSGQVVLLRLPHGYGRSKLTNPYFEKALKVRATTRNWRTVVALRDMCSGAA